MVMLDVVAKEDGLLFCEHEFEGKRLFEGEGRCSGFWEGMHLVEDSWSEIWTSLQEPLMRPCYLPGADELEEEMALMEDPKPEHKLSIEVEPNLPKILPIWIPRKKSTVQQVQNETPKSGRNDPCPCGSGGKYKKCCGAD